MTQFNASFFGTNDIAYIIVDNIELAILHAQLYRLNNDINGGIKEIEAQGRVKKVYSEISCEAKFKTYSVKTSNSNT